MPTNRLDFPVVPWRQGDPDLETLKAEEDFMQNEELNRYMQWLQRGRALGDWPDRESPYGTRPPIDAQQQLEDMYFGRRR